MKIRREALPENFLIASYLPANYVDVYVCTIVNGDSISN
jgi:hypothetical protein